MKAKVIQKYVVPVLKDENGQDTFIEEMITDAILEFEPYPLGAENPTWFNCTEGPQKFYTYHISWLEVVEQ